MIYQNVDQKLGFQKIPPPSWLKMAVPLFFLKEHAKSFAADNVRHWFLYCCENAGGVFLFMSTLIYVDIELLILMSLWKMLVIPVRLCKHHPGQRNVLKMWSPHNNLFHLGKYFWKYFEMFLWSFSKQSVFNLEIHFYSV